MFDRYQHFYDMAYARVRARVDAGKLADDALIVRQRTDDIARTALRSWLKSEGIAEGAGGVILVNRYLRSPASGTWRVPDIRIPGANIIFDGTIEELLEVVVFLELTPVAGRIQAPLLREGQVGDRVVADVQIAALEVH